jgi:hypothetical protein
MAKERFHDADRFDLCGGASRNEREPDILAFLGCVDDLRVRSIRLPQPTDQRGKDHDSEGYGLPTLRHSGRLES